MSNQHIATALLAIKAVRFTPHNPITFSSGLLSPVYVDNRQLVFWPEQWHQIIEGMQALIAEHQPDYDVIAGVAVGGVPHSSALAYALHKPSVFVRKEAKGHGAGRQVEGGDVSGKRVLLIEDMITTGGSSLKGVHALRAAGAEVSTIISITTFGFTTAQQAMADAQITLYPLVDFATIVSEGRAQGYFGQAEESIIHEWMADPQAWTEARKS